MYKVVKYGNVLENTQVVYTGSLRACRYKLSMIKNEYAREGGNKYLNFLQYERFIPVTEQTLETAKKRIKQISIFWVEKEVEGISISDINSFKKHLLDRGCSLNYVRAYTIVLRSFFKYLATITTCIDHTLIKPPNVPKNDVDYLTVDEVRKMLGLFNEDVISDLRSKAMVQVILDTGMRIH